MIGTRECRKCEGKMAVAGGQGHWRCPHCNCWLPTSESWSSVIAILIVIAIVAYNIVAS